ncbi:MAG: HAMP domain-containing methyl-accepting chemotaxis protein [Thiotrichaceae bacterium]
MNFLKNLSIKVWIIGLASVLLLLMLAGALTSIISINNIGQELEGIAEQDIPITSNLTNITIHQLEQAIHFERAFRHGELLETETNAKARFEEEVADFHNRTAQIEKEIVDTEKAAQKAIELAHNEDEVKEFTHINNVLKKIEIEHKDYVIHVDEVFALLAARKPHEAELLGEKVEVEEDQLDKELEDLLTELEKFTEAAAIAAEEHEQTALTALILLSVISLLGGGILSFFAVRNVVNPLRHIQETVETVAGGDFGARIALDSSNEFGQMANSFDKLLDDRLAGLVEAEVESKKLNTSIIGLLQTVAALSQRDLTVKATVTEDVTGSVADALNLMTSETAKVLSQVNKISGNVSTTSVAVKQQSDLVTELAKKEREVVDSANQTLQRTTESMHDVAKLTERSNQTAELAIAATDKAVATVNETVQGINDTRDTIRETEKRIKRLGERSQEINSAVNLINTIAERTHILALNASMHAASAGEAGRGFAVVADEVQRLAESSRDATAQIATLVKNIQVETSETVNTMNDTITQVVAGSRLAQQAGEEMQITQKNTAELVAQMHEIAEKTVAQVTEINNMEDSIAQIRETTTETSNQLTEQANATTDLVEFSTTLVSAVSVFKLPA